MNTLRRLRDVRWLYPLLNRTRTALGRAVMRFCHARWGVEGRTVFFSSYAGRGYSDNPRAVSEALRALRPDLSIVWQFEGGVAPEGTPDYVRVVPAHSLRALRAFSTARCVVDNLNRPQYMLKFPGQLYVQTWHGDRGFKRVLFDMGTNEPFPDGAQMDLAVSGSAFGSRVYRSALHYEGEIMELGCPRNDLLVRNPPAVAAEARAALGIPEGAKALLYAPTFRDATCGAKQAAGLDLVRVRETLESATGERWVCLARGHEQSLGVAADGARDVSAFPDVSRLLLACDMVITDYSSIGGDFMLLDRPAIYFQPDRDAYDAERGLYFDPDRSPLLVAHSEAELLELLSRPIDAAANCRAVLEFFGANETGHAGEAVARWISERVEKPG